MPIRFQVDSDFYDHPKTISLTDSAVALWTRAGSYSAGKLTDGFIPDTVMPKLSATPAESAAELVKAKLWRRVRGGYRFHQWELRNLTRDRIEAERKADRERKQKRHQNNGSPPLPQVPADPIRPESDRSPAGIPDGSVSVSVSVSESLSTSSYVSNASPKDEPRSKPVSIGAAKLSRIYCDRVQLSDRSKVCMIITNATAAGYGDDQIGPALERLASERRPVTPDTLRLEIEGRPGSLVTVNGITHAPDGRPVAGPGWSEA